MNNRFLLYALSVWLLTIATSCDKYTGHEELSLSREPYLDSSLRIDGFYYQKYDGLLINLYFFYRNGVLINPGGSFDNLAAAEGYVKRNVNCFKDSELYWGVFIIHGDSIAFDQWYPRERPYPQFGGICEVML